MFYYHNDDLSVGGLSCNDLANKFGTPSYIYSLDTIHDQADAFIKWQSTQKVQVCYALKANSNLAILQVMKSFGFGFDVVSLGEVYRVHQVEGDMSRCVFSGVGKTDAEIRKALELNIGSINVETMSEFNRVDQIAGDMGILAPVSIRINPNIYVETHPYITTALEDSKFGISQSLFPQAINLCKKLVNIELIGVSCHLGSQIKTVEPFLQSLKYLIDIAKNLHEEGIHLKLVDIGGGMSVQYEVDEAPFPIDSLIEQANEYLNDEHPAVQNLKLIVEPGRYLIANSGTLLSKVVATKSAGNKNYLIVDAAMNDLIRPTLYDASHIIKPVQLLSNTMEKEYVVVGQICESSDILSKSSNLKVRVGDLVLIMDTGAYSCSMSSNYNSRCRAAEVLVDGNNAYLIRDREEIEQLWANEKTLDIFDK